MAGSQAVTLVAEKYLPEVVAGIERPLNYRDALVEPGRITVKTTTMDPTLGGWLGYAFSVSKKGTLSGPTAVITSEPSVSTFLDWAKGQSVKDLQRYLAASGIRATGNITFMLAYRLTYLYEEAYHKRHETWPLDPGRMEARLKKITTINTLLNMKGVGTHPDSDAIGKQLLIQDSMLSMNLTHREESSVADEKHEKRSDVLKRLRAQAKTEEGEKMAGNGKGSKDETTTPPATETAAVKAGKGARKGATAAPTTQAPATAPAADTTENTDMSKKTKGSKKAKATKAESKPAAKPTAEKKGNATAKAKDFQVESKVKYVGTRVKHHVGKTGTVVGHIGEVGLKIKWSDGLVATATAMSVEKVK